MQTAELIKRLKERSHKPDVCIYRMGLYYLLNREGYSISNIASALGRREFPVRNGVKKFGSLLDVNDKLALRTLEILRNHKFVIIPYFTRIDGYYKIRTYLQIDIFKL